MVNQNIASDTPLEAEISPATLSKDNSEDLHQLDSREPVDIFRNLKAEIARKNSILHFLETTSETLAITVLDLIDISATRSSLEEFDVRFIATSARADKIDEEWNRHITGNSSSAS